MTVETIFVGTCIIFARRCIALWLTLSACLGSVRSGIHPAKISLPTLLRRTVSDRSYMGGDFRDTLLALTQVQRYGKYPRLLRTTFRVAQCGLFRGCPPPNLLYILCFLMLFHDDLQHCQGRNVWRQGCSKNGRRPKRLSPYTSSSYAEKINLWTLIFDKRYPPLVVNDNELDMEHHQSLYHSWQNDSIFSRRPHYTAGCILLMQMTGDGDKPDEDSENLWQKITYLIHDPLV